MFVDESTSPPPGASVPCIAFSKRTFQKFFTQEQLRQWIEQALDRQPVTAAPGIFYGFRDEADAQSFAVNRVSRQRRIPGIEESQALVKRRSLGSYSAARRADVLVYLALAAFPKRPRFGALPDELRHDIRAFFGSYRSGCTEADALLFSAGEQDAVDRACRDATVGKLLPDALYVHHSAGPRSHDASWRWRPVRARTTGAERSGSSVMR